MNSCQDSLFLLSFHWVYLLRILFKVDISDIVHELNWTELNWTELNWTELNWTELNWIAD
jgi:hypothetical protein